LTTLFNICFLKWKKSLFFLSNFFLNKRIPIAYKKKVLQSYVIRKAIYFSLLLGSNKSKTVRIKSLIHTGLFWRNGSYAHENSSGNFKNKSEYLRHNPTMICYIWGPWNILPIAGTYAALQVKCFVKWRKSYCFVKDLIKFIPKLSHHSWTIESRILRNKLKENNIKKL